MREAYHPARFTIILIVAFIGAFFLECLLEYYGNFNTVRAFGLSLRGLQQGYFWQLLTYQFLHQAPQPWHVLFNCLGLYFFGRSVEESLGSKKFLLLYFLSGVVGALPQVLAPLVLPKHSDIPVVGASAGVCGMLAIFCSLYPMRELTSFINFIPITIRARYLLWFVAGLSLFGTIVPFNDVAHGAHLGGIAVGLAYFRWFHEGNRFAGFWSRLRVPRRSRPILKVRFPKAGLEEPPKLSRPNDLEAADFISKEVDPILEKISAQGIHSLTERERKILEAARSKMDKE
jgi:membrane associated rhomboid family serine protease